MTGPIEIVRAVRTCSICPSQWDAWDVGGKKFYIRYRWGWLTVERDRPDGEMVLEKSVGGHLHGSMTFAELKGHVRATMSFNCAEIS